MFQGLKSIFGGKAFSNSLAKNRLQMVLVQDRSGLTSQDMDFFRRDLLDVLTKYFVLERRNLEIEWQRSNGTTALIINTPVIGRPKTRKEIDAGENTTETSTPEPVAANESAT